MASITITAPTDRPIGVVTLPRSKSVAARAAIISNMAKPSGPRLAEEEFEAELTNYPDAEDSVILRRLLQGNPEVMDCGMGGTTLRFLLAWAAIRAGEEHLLTGAPRLIERPHQQLVDALRSMGADITVRPDGYLVRGKALEGGSVHFDHAVSSQYISAVMMIGPMLPDGLRVHWTGPRLSEPYVSMTMTIMAHYEGWCSMKPAKEEPIVIESGGYKLAPFEVPTDWSAAAFLYQLVALRPRTRIALSDLTIHGMQSDEAIAHLLNDVVETEEWEEVTMPEIRGFTIVHRNLRKLTKDNKPIDLTWFPDVFPSMAITHAALGRTTTFTGLNNLYFKESDRVAAVREALAQLGIACEVDGGTVTVRSSPAQVEALRDRSFTFSPSNDHRMAMSLASLSLVCKSITINDPEVVNKSYPAFWNELGKLGFKLLREG